LLFKDNNNLIKLKLFLMKILTTLIITLFVAGATAQTAVEYTYDAAGNRIQRKVIVVKSPEQVNDSLLNIPFLEEVSVAEVEGLASVSEHLGNMRVSLHPNPSSDFIYITIAFSDMEKESVQLQLYDLNGRLLQNKTLTELNYTMNLLPYAPGSYVLKLTSRSGVAKEIRVLRQ
jgi:hypothetical protein